MLPTPWQNSDCFEKHLAQTCHCALLQMWPLIVLTALVILSKWHKTSHVRGSDSEERVQTNERVQELIKSRLGPLVARMIRIDQANVDGAVNKVDRGNLKGKTSRDE